MNMNEEAGGGGAVDDKLPGVAVEVVISGAVPPDDEVLGWSTSTYCPSTHQVCRQALRASLASSAGAFLTAAWEGDHPVGVWQGRGRPNHSLRKRGGLQS